MKRSFFLSGMLLFIFAVSIFSPALQVNAQTATPPGNVLALLEEMTPEERVGQLFAVTFEGTDASRESEIYDLIANYHVGGVILLAENDNFTASTTSVADVHGLISTLQKIEWDTSLITLTASETGQITRRVYAPLFVGATESGDGASEDQILDGLTPLPNQMAIGATWQPELAEETGFVLGQELDALGFNLYFGPSLDVLEQPNPTGSGDLGTRVFGGDPYWVGEMGRAFISGLHTGSEGRVLVVAKHFPGRGGSDRLPEEEVATVRKSLEQLKQIELAPFFAVTGDAPSVLETADALLVSHIRYQGFQGNIRATTRPVSLDAQSLAQILELPSFTSWRESGGLTVSDDLGSRAVRQFYAPGNQGFFSHLVARDAFLAGNDILYLGNISSSDTPDTYNSVVNILTFFAQKYREDTAFAQRVNEAVTRILTVKMRLYPYFSLGAVRPAVGRLEELGQSQQAAFDVAQHSATIISPELSDLGVVLPTPPALKDRLIFISDTHANTRCNLCLGQTALSQTALEQSVLRLYGVVPGEQALPENLSSYTFDNLDAMLAGEDASLFASQLNQADWVIFALAGTEQNQSETLRRFISEKQDLLRNKRIILFSFTAPYYLDATDISKLTAYYGLYSYAPPFVDVAARILYKELTPVGASPVSIPGIGYDLIAVTAPDPAQLITLMLDLVTPPAMPPDPSGATPEPTAVPRFRVDDTLAVRTGIIIDHNGHPVPDGTVVSFMLTMGDSTGIQQQVDAETEDGIARAAFQLERTGLLDIRASSNLARISQTLRLDVSSTGEAAVTVIAPSLPEEILSATPVPDPTATVAIESAYVEDGSLRIGAWFFAALVWIFGLVIAYSVGAQVYSGRWGLRWALSVLLGGMGAYNYLAPDLPGASWVTARDMFGVIVFVLLGELLGWGVGWLWWKRDTGE